MCFSVLDYREQIYVCNTENGIQISAAVLIIIFSENHLCDLRSMVEGATYYFFHCIKYSDERQVFNDTFRVFQPFNILSTKSRGYWDIKKSRN